MIRIKNSNTLSITKHKKWWNYTSSYWKNYLLFGELLKQFVCIQKNVTNFVSLIGFQVITFRDNDTSKFIWSVFRKFQQILLRLTKALEYIFSAWEYFLSTYGLHHLLHYRQKFRENGSQIPKHWWGKYSWTSKWHWKLENNQKELFYSKKPFGKSTQLYSLISSKNI